MELNSIELCEITGLSYRQVDYWTRRGVLNPAHEIMGSGTHRRWSDLETRVAVVAATLHRYGLGLDVIAVAAEHMREWSEDEWTGHVFIDDRGHLSRVPRPMTWWLDLDIVAEDRVPA